MLYEKDCLSCSFENTERRGLGEEPFDSSFQHGLLESRLTWTFLDASLRT
jgi:hypothetical protein